MFAISNATAQCSLVRGHLEATSPWSSNTPTSDNDVVLRPRPAFWLHVDTCTVQSQTVCMFIMMSAIIFAHKFECVSTRWVLFCSTNCDPAQSQTMDVRQRVIARADYLLACGEVDDAYKRTSRLCQQCHHHDYCYTTTATTTPSTNTTSMSATIAILY